MPSVYDIRPRRSGRTLLLVAIIIILVAALAGTLIYFLLLDQAGVGPLAHRGDDVVLVTVQNFGSGQWIGGIGYSDGSGQSISGGAGAQTFELHRPAGLQTDWAVAVNVIRMDDSTSLITLKITTEDGLVLREGSTNSAYGVIQLACNVDEMT